jgi:tyrosyl-tRNA synthetase
MWRYYELCTDVSLGTLNEMQRMVGEGALHPKKAKEGLAMRVIDDFHDEQAARDAREEFERVFREKGRPDEIPEHRVAAGDGTVFLPRLLTELGLAASNSEAGRLLKQGAVSVDGEKLESGSRELQVRSGERKLIKVGKRRFAYVLFE